MKIKILSVLMVAMMIFFGISCTINQGAGEGGGTQKPGFSVTEGISGNATLVPSDIKLTQEQLMQNVDPDKISEIEAFDENEEIVVMVTLDDEPLINLYNEKYYAYYGSVAQFARSVEGKRAVASMQINQKALIADLYGKGLITGVETTYNTVMNAVAVTVPYGKVDQLEDVSRVNKVIFSETYNRPMTTSTDASAIENVVDVYETGIFNSSTVSYTGIGTAVAVLDSGFDCSHSVFQNQPVGPLYSSDDIAALLDDTLAAKHTANLEVSDVYYSSKIPFAYDYADKDYDVFPYDSEHGTHVAGIIGGKDDVITGVAVNTQLVLMKVFPDLQQGAQTEDILAALEDAVLLEVDAINMSLGSDCGFSREVDEVEINRVYDQINASGISLITAASNSYSSSMGGEQGNTNFVTNPDSATVGSPSTYAASLSVASISGVKSRYILGNGEQIFFFKESNDITGDENDFFAELGLSEDNPTMEIEYVTVPGVGLRVNFNTVDVKGKVALIRRGDNTFEEKAQNAKNAGAIACIIYNNIDGDISMSMGKSDHIPTVSISKEDGDVLAKKDKGTLLISYGNQAGPFMSDFSSWGPSPDLTMKPEITAHGGNIKSSVPGGGYDELSGTSMASPNLCGIVVLIRQYLKDKYPDYSHKEISVMANQLLMSTATIILDKQGNPYSPRKQGAGLSNLYNAVNTDVYITVPGSDRTKLELKDDPQRTGVYTMTFNVVNNGTASYTYDMGVIGMTESVSKSEEDHVAERAYMLQGAQSFTVKNATMAGNKLTVAANSVAEVTATYTLTDEDKKYIEDRFPYGMYVEGFVTLDGEEDVVDLNVPFLAFYGNWLEAPLFDKTHYEVESEAHNGAIDEEDKLKADYYATTPYAHYFANYIIPLGTYLYEVDESKYDKIPATEEHMALSSNYGALDGLYAVYAGLLRNAKSVDLTITDKVSGEVVYSQTEYNVRKAHSRGGGPVPAFFEIKKRTSELNFVNNREYSFKMMAYLDYGDGGATANVRNVFEFDFYMDNQAPTIKDAEFEKVYDKTLKEDRFYVTLTVYDNHYVQAITPAILMNSSTYTSLDTPIPVYGERGQESKVRFEITDYLKDLNTGAGISSSLMFAVSDYALNNSLYFVQLPGTRGDFKFTQDGTDDGGLMITLTVKEGELVDLTDYLYTADATVDADKDYLKYLTWSSSNTEVADVQYGIVRAMKAGRATITVAEQIYGKGTQLRLTVEAKEDEQSVSEADAGAQLLDLDYEQDTVKELRFSYYDTIKAYAVAGQGSAIGETGNRNWLQETNGIEFYPGEVVQLFHEFDPWYVADKYQYSYRSTNERVATVDEDGRVTAVKEGSATIVMELEGSNLVARVRVTVLNEFVIENRVLEAYKGPGGDVVIPDDEGIMYIGPYAFSLYIADRDVEVDEDDWDANKTPQSNNTVTSVTIPHGVMEIQKYAFYNCFALEEVTILSDTTRFIREFAFMGDANLKSINLEHVEAIGKNAFNGCTSLTEVRTDELYSLGELAFANTSLKTIDLTNLRNCYAGAFENCTSLTSVVLGENTKLAKNMFKGSALASVDIYEREFIPEGAFANCTSLKKVVIHKDLVRIEPLAFAGCTTLSEISMKSVERIMSQAFIDCSALADVQFENVNVIASMAFSNTGLQSFELPNNQVVIEANAFKGCGLLSTLTFGADTEITDLGVSAFNGSAVASFNTGASNVYSSSADGKLLLSKDGKTIIMAAPAGVSGDVVITGEYEAIANGAFAGSAITSVTIENANIVIGENAFADCAQLTKVVLPAQNEIVIKNGAFEGATKLAEVQGLDAVTQIGERAFKGSAITTLTVADGAVVGSEAFSSTALTQITISGAIEMGEAAFALNNNLTTVNITENITIADGAFANCELLATIDLSKAVGKLGEAAFYGCTALTAANLVNVTEIGELAFADCSALVAVNIQNVQKIGNYAFAAYQVAPGPIFQNLTFGEELEFIGDGAFFGTRVGKLVFPDSLTHIGERAFAYATSLTSVQLGSGLKVIPAMAFQNCTALSSIDFANVEEIGAKAFNANTSLTSVDFKNVKTVGTQTFEKSGLKGSVNAEALETIGQSAFSATAITSFRADKLKYIGDMAFIQCTALKEVSLTAAIEYVGYGAFNACSAFTTFVIRQGANTLTNGQINDYAKVVDGVLYTRMPSGNYQLTAIPQALAIETLIVPEGVARVESFSSNANTYIKNIIFPDSLRLIGAYAFVGCTSLESVEFRSVRAPQLESVLTQSATSWGESDPAYEILGKFYNLSGVRYAYYNFNNQAGKVEPISMTVPKNADIEGYDGLIYLLYFGPVEQATVSDYVAMEGTLIDFIEYAKKVGEIVTVTLSHETLINNAITAYNALTQVATDYGYGQAEWDEMVTDVTAAKKQLVALKLANASQKVRDVQALIDELPEVFTIDMLATLAGVAAKIDELPSEDRGVLDLEKYNQLYESYNEYRDSVNAEVTEIVKAADQVTFIQKIAQALSAMAMGAVAVFSKIFLG